VQEWHSFKVDFISVIYIKSLCVRTLEDRTLNSINITKLEIFPTELKASRKRQIMEKSHLFWAQLISRAAWVRFPGQAEDSAFYPFGSCYEAWGAQSSTTAEGCGNSKAWMFPCGMKRACGWQGFLCTILDARSGAWRIGGIAKVYHVPISKYHNYYFATYLR
jgi:hypothetical protein